ncbi:MAG: ATP-binding protein [Desulfovibrionaceae bacterium]|nr:ATP-binding protein [Desulfovibrionaceae bacterium]
MLRPNTIRSAIYLILAICLFPMAGFLAFSSLSSRTGTDANLKQNYLLQLDFLSLSPETVLRNARGLMSAAAALPDLSSAKLADFLPASPYYENIYLTDPAGNVLAAAKNFRPGVNIPPQEYASGLFLPDPFTGRAVLNLAAPRLNEPGETLGRIFLSVNPNFLDYYKPTSIFAEGQLFALDAVGSVMPLYPAGASDVTGEIASSLWELRQQSLQETDFFTSTGKDGKRMVAAYERIPLAEGLILYMIADQAYHRTERLFAFDLSMIFLSILVSLGLSGLLSYLGMLKPAHLLLHRNGANLGPAGKLNKDFKRLAGSFENMAAALAERNREITQASNETMAVNRVKSEFLANMNQGTCTPTNAIVSLTGMMLKTDLPSKQKIYLDKIHEASNNLLGIINDILDLSKLESEQFVLDYAPFRMETLLEFVLNKFQPQAAEKKIRLDWSVSPEKPPLLSGDALRLGQILSNLLSNALKFTEQGGVDVLCRLEDIKRTGDTVTLRLEVRDSGIGMSEEQVGGLFQTFTQVDGSSTRKFGGAGLGLVLCRKLLDLMDGKIHIQSCPGEGTSVHLKLQLQSISEDYLHYGRMVLELAGLPILLLDASPASPEFTEARKNDGQGASLEEQLLALGLRTHKAHTAQEAFRMLRYYDQGERYRLVWLENSKNSLDAETIIRHIRQDLGLSWIPPILLTAPARARLILRKGQPVEQDTADKRFNLPVKKEHLVREIYDLVRHFPIPEDPARSRPAPEQRLAWLPPQEGSKVNTLRTERTPMTQQQESLPPLPGFNENALKRLGNNQKLYRKLLVQFVEFYQDMDKTYENAVAADNLEEATRIAHTLKGLAGSIGVDDLFEKAKNLESAHKDGGVNHPDLAKTCFSRLREVQLFLTQALGLQNQPPPAAPEASPPPSAENKAEAQTALDTLLAYLRDDDGEAVAFYETKQALLESLLDQNLLEQVKNCLAHFEFDSALALLDKK